MPTTAKDVTIMAVHAHPDDEVVFTGGTLLHYHQLGVNTVLVTATGGEEGEIHDPDLDPEEAKPRLRDIRLGELSRGIAVLEIDHHELLGYRDSGMAGTEANAHPENFHNADLEEASRKLVMLVRRYKPQILITYDENGAYGHPDHIKANQITMAGFNKAGDASYAPELGEPWTPLKLYFTHWNDEGWKKAYDVYKERGLEWPFGRDDEEESTENKDENGEQAEKKEEKPPAYVPPATTARINVSHVAKQKQESAKMHRTQFDPNGAFMNVPEDILPLLFGEEHYSLVQSRVDAPEQEDDILAGLLDQ